MLSLKSISQDNPENPPFWRDIDLLKGVITQGNG
jgi:hypothetical protein